MIKFRLSFPGIILILLGVAISSQAQITVSLPDTSVALGSDLTLPVNVGGLTGQNVFAFDLTLNYDSTKINITDINQTGTLTEGINAIANTTVLGQLRVAAATATALSGSGVLINLEVSLLDTGYTELSWAFFQFNEGEPEAAAINGSMTISEPLNPKPNRPQNPVPVDSSTTGYNLDDRIELGWEYVQDPAYSEPDSFRVLLTDSLDGEGKIFDPFVVIFPYVPDQSDYYNSLQQELPRGTRWFWAVIPFNANGEADSTIIWTFTTEKYPLPNFVQDPAPEDGTTAVPFNLDEEIELGFRYVQQAAYSEPDSFKILVSDTIRLEAKLTTPIIMAIAYQNGQTDYSVNIPGLLRGVHKQWLVVPFNAAGEADSLVVWSFGTELYPLPVAAQNPIPADAEPSAAFNTQGKIELGWEYLHDSTHIEPDSFKILLGDSLTLNGNIFDPAIDKIKHTPGWSDYTNAVQFSLPHGVTRYWKVIPYNSNGEADSTVIWSFTTAKITFPNTSQNPSPANEELSATYNSAREIELGWEYVQDPAYFEPDSFLVLLGDSISETEQIVNPAEYQIAYVSGQSNYNNAVQVELPYRTHWFWQVIPYNANGPASGVLLWNFTTAKDLLPNLATNPTPADGEAAAVYNSSKEIEIGWEYVQKSSYSEPDSFKILMGDSLGADGNIYNPFIGYIAYVSGQSDYTNVKQHALPRGSTWYWAVIPYNANGEAEDTIIWSFTTEPEVGISELQEGIPTVYALNQNYPNPFNPVTSISYQLPEAARVRLTIFNLGGQQIATLVNNQQSPGYYTVQWDAGQLSSGIYLYQIEAGSYINVKRAILMK